MRRKKTIYLITVLFALTTTTAGCRKKKRNNRGSDDALPATVVVPEGTDNADADNEGDSGDSGTDGVTNGEPGGLSKKNALRFKRQQLIESDIAKALTLDKDEICNELGSLKCIKDVHYLALGGVDAYEKSIFTGIRDSSSTTPVVIERIALAACGKRAELDFANAASAAIFKGLKTDAGGKLANPDDADVKTAVDSLYKKILKRTPTAAEAADLIGMYGDIAAVTPSGAAKSWAQLSCYTLLTSIEFIFY